MNWKRIVTFTAVVFAISAISSATTWYLLAKKSVAQVSWKEILNLNSQQAAHFKKLEAELASVMKELERDEAQNKIVLCSYLDSLNKTPQEMKSATKKMAESYQKKQEEIAGTLLALSLILTPEQRETFSKRLMQEVCLSCRNATGEEKCLCRMCSL